MAPMILSDDLYGELEDLVLRTPLAKERCRAQALLWLAEGLPAEQFADAFQVSRQTVYNWAERFRQREGLDLRARLLDAPRSGRPPLISGIIDPLIEAAFAQDPGEKSGVSSSFLGEIRCQFIILTRKDEPTSRKKARERRIAGSLKPFRWNPAGNQSRPVEPDQQPEASLAWWVGDHPCEA